MILIGMTGFPAYKAAPVQEGKNQVEPSATFLAKVEVFLTFLNRYSAALTVNKQDMQLHRKQVQICKLKWN